ncbi:MAG: hypothetical protein KJP17_07665, partial [Gammaproteobacteria bacterium]|nr:hypothetical protein [Gammaproteobacteria bacterium]
VRIACFVRMARLFDSATICSMRVIAVPLGAVMTRGASPGTTPKVVRFFCCHANDAVVVCTH